MVSMAVVQFEIKTLITVHRTPNVPKNVRNSFYESSKVHPTVGMLRSLQSHDLRFAPPLPPSVSSEDLCEETLKVHGFWIPSWIPAKTQVPKAFEWIIHVLRFPVTVRLRPM